MLMWKLLVLLGAATLGLVGLVAWHRIDRARVRRRFAGVVDVEREIAARREAFERELASQRGELAAMRTRTRELQHGYATLVAAHAQLRGELTALEHTAEAIAVGLEPPSFPRACPEDYKRELRELRAHQRVLVHDGRAVTYGETWLVRDSRAEGARMQRQYARLLLRAFNGECEAAIAKVRWNNLARMIERLTQAFAAINRLGAAMQLQLTAVYRDSKLDELRLEYALDHQRRLELEDERAARAVELLPIDEGGGSRALDDHARGLARGSIQIQLASHVSRTADTVEIVLGGARSAHPEQSVDEPTS